MMYHHLREKWDEGVNYPKKYTNVSWVYYNNVIVQDVIHEELELNWSV